MLDAARMDALETRIAHQDRMIDELNETITAQWRVIDRLRRDIALLRDHIDASSPVLSRPEPPPPHY